jgi:uncharacterized protein (DUF2147 family)
MNALPLRRHDLDWLRVFAVFLLFVFHTAMVFNPAPFYHIRNSEVSIVMLILAGFISLWHMPLFFLLAGWSAHASLSARGTRGFLRERVFKLWVPLVMGCILLMPPIKYIELRSGLDANYAGLRVSPELQQSFVQVIPAGLPTMPPFDESFWQFLPTFFTDLERLTWAHLWFIAYLLVFTVVYLPLFRWLSARRRDLAYAPGWWIYLPIAPLALVQVFLRPHWPGLQNLYDDWANVGYYSTYLVAGFLLARYPALERAVHREWGRALAIAGATTLVLLLGVLGVFQAPPVLLAGTAVAGWCFVLAALGAAHHFLASVTRGLSYLSESAFPVYWLHQSAIVLIGYGVIHLELGIAAKYAVLLAASVSAVLAVYHFVVRRFSVTRFCVGMKSPPAPRSQAAVVGRAAAMLAIAIATALAPRAAYAATPVGRWYAEGGAAQVEITPCGEQLCGQVVWLRSPFDEDGCDLHDNRNPEPTLRDRPIIGLQILAELHPADDARSWTGGTIYDPTSGRTYQCTLELEGDDRLRVRGYIGVPLLGRTTTWIRVGTEHQMCSWRDRQSRAAAP